MQGLPADSQSGSDEDDDQGRCLRFSQNAQYVLFDKVETTRTQKDAGCDHAQDTGQSQTAENKIPEQRNDNDDGNIGQHKCGLRKPDQGALSSRIESQAVQRFPAKYAGPKSFRRRKGSNVGFGLNWNTISKYQGLFGQSPNFHLQ
jgi:hypothetical protein